MTDRLSKACNKSEKTFQEEEKNIVDLTVTKAKSM